MEANLAMWSNPIDQQFMQVNDMPTLQSRPVRAFGIECKPKPNFVCHRVANYVL